MPDSFRRRRHLDVLDAQLASASQALVDKGMTMVVVTHEMTFVRRVGDWVAIFDAGRIVEQGPPRQIFDAPTRERTRDFLRPPRLARRDALAAIRHDILMAS